MKGPWRLAAQHVGVDGGIGEPAPQAELGEGGPDVADQRQLLPDPALTQLRPRSRPGQACPGRERLGNRLGRQHAGLHRGMRALDLRHVDEPGSVADQRAAGERQARDRLEAALVQRARAVADAPAALEMPAHRRMRLEALHLVERREPGIAVIEADDEAVGDQVVAEMVEERPAIGAAIERPADRVFDQARLVVRGGTSHSSLMPMA